MAWLKGRIGKIPYKYVIGLCVLGLISILVIVFVGYIYYDYQRECQEAAGREAEYMTERVVSQVEERLNNLKQYYLTTVEEEDIKWILENDLHYSDYSRYKGASDAMANENLFGDYIRGYTFVNFKTGWVLSNKGMFPLEESHNGDVLFDLFNRNNEGLDKNYWLYNHSVNVENTVNRKYRLTIEDSGLSLVIKLPAATLNVYGMMIVNIDMDMWQTWIKEWLYDYEDVVVLDKEGSVIYATDSRLEESSKKLQASDSAKKIPEKMEIGGVSTYMVSAKASDVMGWEYYVWYDMEEGPAVSMRFSGMVFAVMALVIVGCFILVTYVMYRPVDQFVKNIAEKEQKIKGNEFDYLAHRIANLKDDKQLLESVLNQQQNKLQELFELRLIRGEVRSTDEWDEYFKELHLTQWKCFATVVMVLNLRGENEAQSNVNEDAICLKMVEEMPEDLKALAWMPPVYNACTIFCMFGAEDETALFKRIMEFHDGIQKHTENMFGFRMLMGVSATHTDYHHIRAAYRESINALTMQSRALSEQDSLMGREDCHFYLNSTTVGANSYNHSFEKEIQTAIKAMDKSQCYKVTDEFYLYLTELKGGHDEAMVYILRYINTILLTAMEAKVDLEALYPDGLRKVYREILEVVEPARVRRYTKWKLIDPILQARSDLLENRSYSMMEEIERQIEESKGNITLTECAEAVGVHPTYIWKVLKMEKGKSFSDYLEEYKLSEAKRLLLQTNMTVAEIAMELNYTNAQNFIRFFSKGTGVTPGKFRKLY